MDITQIGSLNTYLKQTKLETQWNLKKETGNYSAHTKSLDEWLSDQTEATDATSAYTASSTSSDSSTGDTKLQSIQQKLYTGKTLTAEEKSYLQEKDPIAYGKAQAMEMEQKSYEAELRRCKTKEDVQRLKMAHLGASLTAVKSVENNPNITTEKKLEVISMENGKNAALERITQKFVKKGYYDKLPTDAEKAEAEKEQREAAAAQEERPEQTEEQTGEPSVAKIEEKSDAASKAEEPTEDAKADTAQESPEARKVRRAKVVAAYAQLSDPAQEVATSAADGGVQLDTKA
jgi:hypothetical protein